MAEFDVNKYWIERGRTYLSEERLNGPYHRLQEQFLLEVIQRGELPAQNILELGCGFGRVTRLLSEQLPQSKITAVDLSMDQLNNARSYCGGKQNITFGIYDFYSEAPLPGERYDLTVAVEVFLHHPAEVVLKLIKAVSQVSTCIVNIDWSEPWRWKTPEHVWVHDYERLYRQAGLKWVVFVPPEKVDGKQQKLFVAAHELPAALVRLEQQLNRPLLHGANSRGDWLQRLDRAAGELKTVIPPESLSILVDENHWGKTRNELERAMLPFLERNGQYWGLPKNDEAAIGELERMRGAGAQYLIFPWHSFWWLEYYTGFRQRLHVSFPCLVRSHDLIVFKLR
jgi:SAM-dependent methyltransferase